MTEYFHLKSRIDHLELGVVMTIPEDEDIRGIVQFAHGMCGCKERFLPAMQYLSERGFACIANDHRGHGTSIRSERDRGYMYRGGYEALVDDMKTVSDYAGERFPGKPLYLVGHSMGSLAARIYAKKHGSGLAGLFLCGSPAENPQAGLGMVLCKILCLLGLGHVRPKALQRMESDKFNEPFASEGPQAWTCSDPAVRQKFASDPTCNFTFTANGAYNLLAMMRLANNGSRAENPGLPIILMNGADDTCSKGARGLARASRAALKAGYISVRSLIYPGMRHEILNEPRRDMVLEDMISIMDSISGKK
ncbi:MAG: alpha/beta fold hydrolase [Candidatus Cryptobacteroides sp.]